MNLESQEKIFQDLDHLSNKEDLLSYVENFLHEQLLIDGIGILFKEKEYYCLTSSLTQKVVKRLPDSLSKRAWEEGSGGIVNQAAKDPNFSPSLDNPDEVEISTLIFSPKIETEKTQGVFLLYKKVAREKEQIVMPLVVGSKVVGVTTKSQRKTIHQEFSKNDFLLLVQLRPILRHILERLVDLHQKEKSSVSSHLVKRLSFDTSQQALEYLYERVLPLKASVFSLQLVYEKLLKEIDERWKTPSALKELSELVIQMKEEFDQIEIALNPFYDPKEQEEIESLKAFQELFHLLSQCISSASLKPILFFDPLLPKRITFPKESFNRFVLSLLELAIQDADQGSKVECRIQKNEDVSSFDFSLLYRKSALTTKEIQDYQKILQRSASNNPKDKELLASYRKLRLFGMKPFISYTKNGDLKYSFKIKYSSNDPQRILDPISKGASRISMLIRQEKDMEEVNNLARYLMRFHSMQERIIVAEEFDLLPKDTTHLFIFESQYKNDLFQRLKEEFQGKILLVDESEVSHQNAFFDYSIVDAKITKGDLCLEELYDFIAH